MSEYDFCMTSEAAAVGLGQGIFLADPGPPETWLPKASLNLSLLNYEMEVVMPALSPRCQPLPDTFTRVPLPSQATPHPASNMG